MTKKIIVASLIILALFTIGTVVYLYPQTPQKTSANNTQANSSTTTQTLQPPMTTSTYHGMKFYRNKEYGFEFWYPEGWEMEENIWGSLHSKFNLTVTKIDGKNTNGLFRVNVVPVEFSNNSYQSMREKVETILVDGIKSLKYKYTQDPVYYTDVIIPISTSTSVIIGDVVIAELKPAYTQGFNKILSTFKFIK